jgi:hypothetical protein
MILCVCTYVEATAPGWKPNCSKINNSNNKSLYYVFYKSDEMGQAVPGSFPVVDFIVDCILIL